MASPKKIVLAYSGGLDTSVILHWLQDKYQAEVVAFCADVGQNEDLDAVRSKSKTGGAVACEIRDLREREGVAQAFTEHPALLRLLELETLRDLAQTANARIYVNFDNPNKPESNASEVNA